MVWQAGRHSFLLPSPPCWSALLPLLSSLLVSTRLFFFPSPSLLISNIPPFLFQAICTALPMPHPSFSLHAVSLYPWQPMISFSPELGGRPRARRGVFTFVCEFWHGNGGGGRAVGFNGSCHISLFALFRLGCCLHSSSVSSWDLQSFRNKLSNSCKSSTTPTAVTPLQMCRSFFPPRLHHVHVCACVYM